MNEKEGLIKLFTVEEFDEAGKVTKHKTGYRYFREHGDGIQVKVDQAGLVETLIQTIDVVDLLDLATSLSAEVCAMNRDLKKGEPDEPKGNDPGKDQ